VKNKIISNYGIKLIPISEGDRNILLEWRNSDFVKQFMVFQDQISEHQHDNWLNHVLHSENDYYFIISNEKVFVGLINVKNIDIKKNEGEVGIFLSKPERVQHNKSINYFNVMLLHSFVWKI